MGEVDGRQVHREVGLAQEGPTAVALQPADSSIAILVPGYVPWRRRLDPSTSNPRWTVGLTKSVVVSGSVISADTGEGIQARGDATFVSNPKFLEIAAFRTDPSGRFAVQVAPGGVSVEISAAGYSSRSVQFTTPLVAPLRIALQAAATLEGRLLDVNGVGIVGVVSLAPLRSQGLRGRLRARAAGDGAFAIRDVARGVAYEVYAETSSCAEVRVATVDGSQLPTSMDVRLPTCLPRAL